MMSAPNDRPSGKAGLSDLVIWALIIGAFSVGTVFALTALFPKAPGPEALDRAAPIARPTEPVTVGATPG